MLLQQDSLPTSKNKYKLQNIPRGAFLVAGTSVGRICSKSAGPDQDGSVIILLLFDDRKLCFMVARL